MALIGEPKVLFLDEPTLGLDVLARRELWRAVESLKGRITVVLTTHYMEEAEALSDRIGVMIGGRLAAVGTLGELEARTGESGLENAFVALTTAAGSGETEVSGGTKVPSETEVSGGTEVSDQSEISGGAEVSGDASGKEGNE